VREIRSHGSEGGEAKAFPTPTAVMPRNHFLPWKPTEATAASQGWGGRRAAFGPSNRVDGRVEPGYDGRPVYREFAPITGGRRKSLIARFGEGNSGFDLDSPSSGFGFPSSGFGFPSPGFGIPSSGFGNPSSRWRVGLSRRHSTNIAIAARSPRTQSPPRRAGPARPSRA
jgi:hypothetical protein